MEHRFEDWQEDYKEALLSMKESLLKTLEAYYQDHPEIIHQDVLRIFTEIFEQERQKEKEPHFLYISFLITSVATRTYDLEFRCYNEREFLDTTSSVAYLSYPSLAKSFENQLKNFEEQISKEHFQVLPYELEEFRKLSSWILYEIFQESIFKLWQNEDFFKTFSEIVPPTLETISYGYLYNRQQTFFNIIQF